MRDFLYGAFQAALNAARPQYCLPPHLPTISDLPHPKKGRIVVVGAGKASAAMAQALEAHAQEHWPDHWPTLSGLVITRHGQSLPLEKIKLVTAAHPVPDDSSRAVAQKLLTDTVKGLCADDVVLALISGGGSALMSLPAEGLAFSEKQAIFKELLKCGASISEINTVRKHLSAIKGGRLALACAPAKVHTFLISDVPGDDLGVIASGPTLPDPSTCSEALAIIQRYGINVSAVVRDNLRNGAWETVKPKDPRMAGHTATLIANPRMALVAAADYARTLSIPAYILADDIEGSARDCALFHASLVRSIYRHNAPFTRPCLVLSGGETTVNLMPGDEKKLLGQGGRNVEFLLHLLEALRDDLPLWPQFCALCADTDGVDGSREVAGAYVFADSLQRADKAGRSLAQAIAHHDGHGFFDAIGDSLITGATHTNVNDFRALFVQ